MATFCLSVAITGFFAIPPDLIPKKNTSVKLFDQIDFLGPLSGVCGLVLLNFSWNEAACCRMAGSLHLCYTGLRCIMYGVICVL